MRREPMNLTPKSLRFDTSSCTFESEQEGTEVWTTTEGDLLAVAAFDSPPSLPASLESVDEVREFYRQLAARAGMGLVEAETVVLDGHQAIWTLLKVPQEPTGMSYLGSLTFPFPDGSLVVKLQCQETGITGAREALVLNEKLASGEVGVAPSVESDGGMGVLIGWFRDPYGAPTEVAPLWCLSDAAAYDALVPNHPLSRLRRQRHQILETITFPPVGGKPRWPWGRKTGPREGNSRRG
jgi:hypothetical protein